jgi:hypothetical protein
VDEVILIFLCLLHSFVRVFLIVHTGQDGGLSTSRAHPTDRSTPGAKPPLAIGCIPASPIS